MTRSRDARQFSPTEHLASEAIAAYVDGELRMNAYLRAAHHLTQCTLCMAEVDAQQQARIALRASSEMSMPSSLLGALHRIPTQHQFPCASSDTDDTRGPGTGLRHGLGSAVSARFRRR